MKSPVHLCAVYSAEWKCPLQRHRKCEGCELLHSSQPMVPPFPIHCQYLGWHAKHWHSAYSASHSVFCRSYQEGKKGCPTAGSHEEWQSPLSSDKTQGKGCLGKEEREVFIFLDFDRTGMVAVPLQVLSLFSYPANPLSFPQTSPTSLHSSELCPPPQHMCYLFSFSTIWAFCSGGLISFKLQTPLTEADYDNLLRSSFLFFPVFCQRSCLNWHWLVVGQVQRHQALTEHPLELPAHVKMSSLENLCDCRVIHFMGELLGLSDFSFNMGFPWYVFNK